MGWKIAGVGKEGKDLLAMIPIQRCAKFLQLESFLFKFGKVIELDQ